MAVPQFTVFIKKGHAMIDAPELAGTNVDIGDAQTLYDACEAIADAGLEASNGQGCTVKGVVLFSLGMGAGTDRIEITLRRGNSG